MQNFLIIGVIVIIGIGGFALLQTTNEPAGMNDPMMVEEVATTDTMPMNNDSMMDETNMEQDQMDDLTTTIDTASPDIVETAIATPELDTLVTAVTQAELVSTLQSDGPFTVFAPANEAFTALPPATLEALLEPENIADLQAILTYHVVPGAVLSGDLTDGMVVETVNGESITINVDDGGVSINGSANVSVADIQTSNGIVHIIDSVLLPGND